MVSDKYHLHVQRYWLRDESLSAGNSKPLSSLLNQDTSALQNSLQAIVGKLVFEQLNCAKNEVASISPVKRASLDESEICRESSKSRFVLKLTQQIAYCTIIFRYYGCSFQF